MTNRDPEADLKALQGITLISGSREALFVEMVEHHAREHLRLREECKDIERDRDYFRNDCARLVSERGALAGRVETLESENRALWKLSEYGRHYEWCNVAALERSDGSHFGGTDCDCGFDAARAALGKEPPR